MSDLRTAAQQALEALEGVFESDEKGAQYWTVTGGTYEAVYCKHAITALKAALEQPEQEPVAWTTMPHTDDWLFVSGATKPSLPGEWHPLYTRPTRRLTDEVIADLWHKNGTYHHHFARAIERWLKGQE